MKILICLKNLHFQLAIFLSILWIGSAYNSPGDFLECIRNHSDNLTAISKVIYTRDNSSYTSILDFYIQNLRFNTSETPKPQFIITPDDEKQIQTAIFCSKKNGLQIRIRSGGHDFEGISYVSESPFVLLDMHNFRSISVDLKTQTAWVGTGATLGELYYEIAQKNGSLAFPAGYWPTVAVGGLISGGGYGPLVRKYGLASDNVIDARVIDANGTILDRKSMGEDFFWALRGGVGSGFGVVVAYKLQLLEVPKKVAAFTVTKTLEENATQLIYKWQHVAPNLPSDVMLSAEIISIDTNQTNKRTILATFHSVFLGGIDKLLQIITEHFPELGVTQKDCSEIDWVEYYIFYLGLPLESTKKVMLSRVPPAPKVYFKSKSDLVQKPIPEKGLEEMWDLFFKIDAKAARLDLTPFGGRMDEILETETPFPHRKGNSYIMYQKVEWEELSEKLGEERIDWIRKFHQLVGCYVDKKPRGAYANYKDLDLGVNDFEEKSLEKARRWGAAYFKDNFERLVKVKTLVDPENFFRNQQSIPPSSPFPSLLGKRSQV